MSCTTAEKLKESGMADYGWKRNASHPPYTYEEDVVLFYQGGLLGPHLEPHDSTELATWFYNNTNKDSNIEWKLFRLSWG
jgi:hypothetical protein